MIRRSLLLIAVLILAVGLIPACSGDDTTAPGVRAIGTIEGTVYDVAAGEPLGGATVSILSSPFATDISGTYDIQMATSTDIAGNFIRADIPVGFVKVIVKKDGYRTPDAQTWALTPGGTGHLTFEMAPGEDPIPEFEGDEQNAHPPEWEGAPEG